MLEAGAADCSPEHPAITNTPRKVSMTAIPVPARRRACPLLCMSTKPVVIAMGSRTIFSPQFWLPLCATSPGDWLWNTPSKDDSSYNGMWRGFLIH